MNRLLLVYIFKKFAIMLILKIIRQVYYMNKKDSLTKNEQNLMEIFWKHEEPLTSTDLTELAADQGWVKEYILNTIRALLNKDMVEVCGVVQSNTQYARQFRTKTSREEYAARLVRSAGIDDHAIAQVTMAMVRSSNDRKAVIQDLQKMIRQLEEEDE